MNRAKKEDKKTKAPAQKKHDVFKKSVSNVPRCEFTLAMQLNGYDVACAHDIVVTESALNQLQEWLRRDKR